MLPTGKMLLTLAGHTDWVMDVAFSPDSKRLVTASGDSTAKVWEVASGRDAINPLRPRHRVPTARFSKDGTRLVTASLDGMAKVWDAATGRTLLTLAGHTGPVRDAAVSPDGTRVATASADLTAKVWDISPGGSREWLTVAASPITCWAWR